MILNPQQFVIEIPDLHPLSNDYLTFWREERKNTIEGKWLGGHYMPAGLYFYVNYGTILLNKKSSRNIKSVSRPYLRDIEWEFFYNWTEARGFSGFLYDEDYTGVLAVLDPTLSDEYFKAEYPEVFNSQGQKKQFLAPRTLLSMQHPYHKGPALFSNEAHNFMMLGSRSFGKTYMVAVGCVLHSWLTSGKTIHGELQDKKSITISVGAELASYSSNLLTKTKFALENLPGSKNINGRYYPAPFAQQYKGSWGPGNDLISEAKVKRSGGWETIGSKATIRHKSFKDNPFALQGGREAFIVLEEIGMFSNLLEVYMATKDNLRNDLRKTGTLMMLGTGGDMESGTIDAHKMFYDPLAYDILAFQDIWENKGNIAYFVPAYLALNEYKNEHGYSDIAKATEAVQRARDKARTSRGGSEALNKEIQYRPLAPSEMFLSRTANIFPAAELQRRISELTTSNLAELLEKKVELYFDPNSPYNGVNYKIDPDLIAINHYPYTKDDVEGSVIIYEFPHFVDNQLLPDAYIIGYDSFKANTNYGESFAAVYVMKTNKYPSTVGSNEIVACYVGRPYEGVNAVNEIVHKLSLFYGNAKIYFENTAGNTKDYFEKIKRLDLLAVQPTTVLNKKASYDTKPNVVYGYPMSNQKIKWEAIKYVRSWLLESRDSTKRNLDVIPDLFLLQQLLAFDMDTNADAVMALVGCVIGLEEIYNRSLRTATQEKELSQYEQDFFKTLTNNQNLFYLKNEKLSKTTSAIYN